jgi:hypothetical protein
MGSRVPQRAHPALGTAQADGTIRDLKLSNQH